MGLEGLHVIKRIFLGLSNMQKSENNGVSLPPDFKLHVFLNRSATFLKTSLSTSGQMAETEAALSGLPFIWIQNRNY